MPSYEQLTSPQSTATVEDNGPLDAAAEAGMSAWDTISAPLRGLGYVVDQTLAAPTRSLAGGLVGAPSTQQPIFFGLTNAPVPTGRNILEAFGASPNDPNKWELSDVLGGGVEMALDPSMYVGVGELTAAGKLAARATKLGQEAEALTHLARAASGEARAALLGKADEAILAMREVQKAAGLEGTSTQLGKNWAEQGRLGQRSALTIPGIGHVGGELPLGLMAGAGQLASKPFRGLYEGLLRRPGSFVGRAGLDTTQAAGLEELAYQASDAARSATREAADQVTPLSEQLNKLSPSLAQKGLEAALPATRADVTALEDQLAARHGARIQSLETRRAAAEAVGDDMLEAKLRHQIDTRTRLMEQDITSADPLAPLVTRSLDDANTSWKARAERFLNGPDLPRAVAYTASELRDVPAKLEARAAVVTERYSSAIDRAEAQMHDLFNAGAPTDFGSEISRLKGRVTRYQNLMNDKVAELMTRKDIAESTLAAFPQEARDAAARYGAITDRRFIQDVGSGVPLRELGDPMLSYVHAVPIPGAIEQAQKMGLAGGDNVFTRYARSFNPADGFTMRRAEAFRGMTRPQVNDLWNKLGGKGQFFSEDLAESALRRVTAGGEASAAAQFQRGVAQMFGVPAKLSKAGDLPVGDFLHEANVARIGDVNLPLNEGRNAVHAALKGTGLDTSFVPKAIAKEALRTVEMLSNPAVLNPILRVVDDWQNLLRWSVTQPFPGFYVKNRFGNWTMMAMVGMRDPQWVLRMRQTMGRIENGTASAEDISLVNRMVDKGAIGSATTQVSNEILNPRTISGRFVKGIETAPGTIGGKVAGKPGQWAGDQVKKFLQTGQRWENEDKGALFMWGKSKGMTDTEAAKLVRERLFDYGDLSRFEKGLRRWVYFYCVPDDCEILTREGWKKHGQLEVGEEVLGLDADTGKSKWTPLTGIATFDYDGEMLTLGNDGKRGGYFPFTPNHRWPYVKPNGERGICRGYELNTNMHIPRAAEMESWPETCDFTPDEAAIMGWMLTDGCFQKDGSWWMYQHPKKFIADIRRLLGDECTEHVHPDNGTVMFYIKASLRKRIQEKGFVSQKSAAAIVGTLTKECAVAMWDAMYKADGTTGKRNSDFFAKQNPVVFDVAQMLVQMLGDYMGKTARGGYVSRGTHRRMKVSGNLGATHYTGKIWCPQTGTGTWLMRRNGKAIFTGNTWQRKMIPLLLQDVFHRPGLGTGYAHLTGQMGQSSQQDQLPRYSQDRGMIPIGDNRYLAPDLPFGVLNRFSAEGRGPMRSLQQVASQIAPVPQTLANLVTQADLARGRPQWGGVTSALSPLNPLARFNRAGQSLTTQLSESQNPLEVAARLVGFGVISTDAKSLLRKKMSDITNRQYRLSEAGIENPVADFTAKTAAGKDLAKARAAIVQQMRGLP